MKPEKIISLFSDIISHKNIDKGVDSILKNLDQVMKVAQKIELPQSEIEKFVKLGDKEVVRKHLADMDMAQFNTYRDFFQSVVGQTPEYVEKKSLLNFQHKIEKFSVDLCLLGGDYADFEDFKDSLSRVDSSKVEKATSYALVIEAFTFSSYYLEHHFDLDVAKESMDLYTNKNFMELAITTLGADKKLKRSIENNISEMVNSMTQSVLPMEGEKTSLIKRSEHTQALKMLGKIVSAYDLNIDPSKIKSVEEFNTQHSSNYLVGVQKNLDNFVSGVEKKKTKLVL